MACWARQTSLSDFTPALRHQDAVKTGPTTAYFKYTNACAGGASVYSAGPGRPGKIHSEGASCVCADAVRRQTARYSVCSCVADTGRLVVPCRSAVSVQGRGPGSAITDRRRARPRHKPNRNLIGPATKGRARAALQSPARCSAMLIECWQELLNQLCELAER